MKLKNPLWLTILVIICLGLLPLTTNGSSQSKNPPVNSTDNTQDTNSYKGIYFMVNESPYYARVGTTININWSGGSFIKGPFTVVLCDGIGNTITTIAPGVSGSSVTWIVPTNISMGEHIIKVLDSEGHQGKTAFIATDVTLKITSPGNGSSNWRAGDKVQIAWVWGGYYASLPPVPVDIYLNKHNILVTKIGTGVTANPFPWTVPINMDPDVYEIQVIDNSGQYQAKRNVNISLPILGIDSVKGTWVTGSNLTINWSCLGNPGLLNFNLKSWVGGNSWPLAKDVLSTAGSGQITVQIPSSIQGQYYIQMISKANDAICVNSDTFVINPPPPPPPPSPLVSAKVIFNTLDDNKNYDTQVFVVVSDKATNKIIAQIKNAADTIEYAKGSINTLQVTVPGGVTKNDCNNLKVMIGSQANGNDYWKFYATLILTFADGKNIIKISPNQRVLYSLGSQYVETDLDGPPVTPPAQAKSGTAKVYMTHPSAPSSYNQHSYGVNYYEGCTQDVIPLNARITGVKNISNAVFNLWLNDIDGKVSPNISFSPNSSSAAFNGMKLFHGIWGAAVGTAPSTGFTLEVTWEEPVN